MTTATEVISAVLESTGNCSTNDDLLSKSEVHYDGEEVIDHACISAETAAGTSIIGTLGNFSLFIGKAKAKKTFLLILLLATYLKQAFGLTDGSNSKIKVALPADKNKILFFDNEQGEKRAKRLLRRIIDSSIGKDRNADIIKVYNLRPNSTQSRIELIEHAIYTRDGVGIVVIDGVRDLMLNINDPEESTLIVGKLMKWSEERNIHIMLVLHENKNDNNPRGHIGTELTNKAETVIKIQKDKDAKLSIVSSEYQRDLEFEDFAIGINENGHPYYVEEWTQAKAAEKDVKKVKNASTIGDDFHKVRLKEAINNEFPNSYDGTWKSIKAAFSPYQQLGNNSAMEFLKYYQIKGWVSQKNIGKRSPVYVLREPL